jgi:hypothetical protein
MPITGKEMNEIKKYEMEELLWLWWCTS